MSAVTSPPLVDERARVLAAGELSRNVVVSAGAGTGKTRLLIDRLTLLLVGLEVPIDKLVAITFTKKAAEEMRDRLERRLRDLIADPRSMPLLNEKYPSDDDRRVALATKALDDIPKAQIGTIHSFAGHLLRLYPVQAAVDPAFREDDGAAFERVFEEEWRAWLSLELALGSPREEGWRKWLSVLDLSDFRATAWALSADEAALDALATPEDPRPLMRVSVEAIDRLINENGIPKGTRVLAPRLEALRRVFEAVGAGKKPSDIDVVAVEMLEPPKEWKEKIEVASVLQTLKKRGLLAAAIDEKTVAIVTAAVAPFVRRFRKELTRRGSLSFDDLLLKARNLLRDHITVRAALKKHYHTFLVDEFQDTDPLQGEILFYLAESPDAEADDWRSVRLAQGRLFVVGDPKQSIYRFRGADIAAFEEFWKRMVHQDALEAALTSNFRSERHILECINGVFGKIMRHEPYIQPVYEALSCGLASQGDPACEMILVTTEENETAPVEVLRDFEADLIAERIVNDVGSTVNGAALGYRDFAILLRSTNAFGPYLDALRERGIPFLAEGEKTYFRRPEISELSNVLAVLCDPSDQLALCGVLRSPFGGLTDAEVLELRGAESLDIRRAPSVLKDKVGPLYALLRDLLSTAHARPVPDLIRGLFDEAGFIDLAAGRRHGEQAVANLRKVAQIAEKWSQQEPLTLLGFVRKLQEYRDEKRDEGENPLADVQYDAVRVMTIHKAKGLEFRCVFLPNISAVSGGAMAEPEVVVHDWRSGGAGLRLPSGVVNAARLLIDEEIRRREVAEELRVFYVAATRAKDRLIFVGRDPAPARAPFAGFLTRAGAWPERGVTSVLLGETNIPVTPALWKSSPRSRRAEAAVVLAGDWSTDRLAKRLAARKAEYENCRKARLISTPTGRLHAVALAEVEKTILDDDEDLDETPAIRIGHICHWVMEHWNFRPTGKGTPDRLEKAIALAASFYKEKRAEISSEVQTILSTFLSSDTYRRLCAVKLEGREVPFFFSLGIGDGPRFMRGFMDLVYRENGRLVVADYKTNRVTAETIDAVTKSYGPQGAVYVEALEKITGEKPVFELLFLRTGEARRI